MRTDRLPLSHLVHRGLLLTVVLACAVVMALFLAANAETLLSVLVNLVGGARGEWQSWEWDLL
ncbi:hypothetical protein ACFV4N_24750 [Actinosynnema sp. NPDC059797]